jgi:cytochrome P450
MKHNPQVYDAFPALEPFYFQFEKEFNATCIPELFTLYWPTVPLTICATYLAVIFGGDYFMKSTGVKPLNLKWPLAMWNLFLSTFSFCGMVRMVPHMLMVITQNGYQESVCRHSKEIVGNNASGLWMFLFIASKLPELVDTVFIVLRQKPLILLHWYHHISVLCYCWQAYAEPAANGGYFGAMNFTVHCFMYGYYFLMAMKMKPAFFRPEYITFMQLAQMFGGIAVVSSSTYYKMHGESCSVSYFNLTAAGLMYASYFLLFFLFALNRYGGSAVTVLSICLSFVTIIHLAANVLSPLYTVLLLGGPAYLSGLFAFRWWGLKHVAGPAALPVLGSLWDPSLATKLLTFLMDTKRKYGEVFVMWMGATPTVVIMNAEVARKILKDQSKFKKGNDYATKFKPVFGNGLVTSAGEHHRKQRVAMNPLFTADRTDKFYDTFKKHAAATIEEFIKPKEGMPMNIIAFLENTTLRCIGEFAFSLDYSKVEPEVAKNITHFSSFGSNYVGESMVYGTPMPERGSFWLKFMPGLTKLYKLDKAIHKHLQTIIDDHRKKLGTPEEKADPVTAMLNLNISEEDLRFGMSTIVNAGHDTTTYTSAYSLYLLARHPEVQERVRATIQDLLKGKTLSDLTVKDMKDCPLLVATVKETLRMYASIPFLPRECTEDVELDLGEVDKKGKPKKLKLPKGTSVLMPIFLMHRDADKWNDSREFRPERHIVGHDQHESSKNYLPFSYGQRVCIGQTMAQLEVMLLLVMILSEYKVSVAPGFRPAIKAGISLVSGNGMCLVFEKL